MDTAGQRDGGESLGGPGWLRRMRKVVKRES